MNEQIENLRKEYQELGGSLEEVQSIDSVEEMAFLVNLQSSIKELESDSSNNGSESQSDLQLIESLKQELESLPYNSEEWRQRQNQILFYENKTRKELGLQPKQYEVLDSDLAKLLQLDGNEISSTCREYISKFEDNIPLQKSLEFRLTQMKNSFDLIQKQELEKTQFDVFVSSAWESVKNVPVRYTEDSRGKLIKNPGFTKWYNSAKTLQTKLNSRIHYLQKMEQEGEENVDLRERIFRIHKDLSALLEQQGVSNNVRTR
ncbi:MAG: hypothetical protein CVU57_16090 [Deltaproteobacteria bacterium HGW-Deltaproteobacteria-15]|jgi:hypothetical protein|nr:MAG: hypothetical protein CVU57_16090 [Deltaproteobacteria bacterium HGW-Deltaproteobacteria-15]